VAALGAAAMLLASCSGSSAGLIPASAAGPLRGDFERVARAAESGNGKCEQTEAAISQTEVDFAGLPSSVNGELRATLRRGIANLRLHALALCTQPLPQPTTTTAAPTTTKTTTTPTVTETTPTETAPTTSTPTPPGPGGGTPAEESSGGDSEKGKGEGAGSDHGGGAGGGLEAGK
jgi:hypothetical protein